MYSPELLVMMMLILFLCAGAARWGGGASVSAAVSGWPPLSRSVLNWIIVVGSSWQIKTETGWAAGCFTAWLHTFHSSVTLRNIITYYYYCYYNGDESPLQDGLLNVPLTFKRRKRKQSFSRCLSGRSRRSWRRRWGVRSGRASLSASPRQRCEDRQTGVS